MIHNLKFTFIILFAIVNINCNRKDNNTIQYYISSEKTEDLIISKNPVGSYTISIKLKEPFRLEFANFTGKNVNKTLEVIWENNLLVKAIIKSKIDSGFIRFGNFETEYEAERFIQYLLNLNKPI